MIVSSYFTLFPALSLAQNVYVPFSVILCSIFTSFGFGTSIFVYSSNPIFSQSSLLNIYPSIPEPTSVKFTFNVLSLVQFSLSGISSAFISGSTPSILTLCPFDSRVSSAFTNVT